MQYRTPPYTTPASSGPRRRVPTAAWAQWLYFLRVRGSQLFPSGTLLLYLRQFSPGSQRLSQAIPDKCWIDPGTRWIALGSLFGPEMDCIWLLLALFLPGLHPFDPGSSCSGPLGDRIQGNPSKGSIIEIRDENNEKPAMRGPFLTDSPDYPELPGK